MSTAIRPFKNITPKLAKTAYVDPAAVVIGDVEIAADASIWPCAVVRGDVQSIKIGERSNIQDGCVVHVTHDSQYQPGGLATVIGNDVTIGHNATIHACTIEDETLIGMNAVILDGAVVHKHVIVAAGSVVGPGKKLQSGFLWRGSPARAVRELSKQELGFFKYSAAQYVKLKNSYTA